MRRDADGCCCLLLAAQSQLEQEMQQQQDQGLLLHGEQLAEFSRLEAEANAKTSKTKTAHDTLATTQQARPAVTGLLHVIAAYH